MRAIMSATEVVEMEHHGANTLCCGSGGIVSMVAPEVSQQRAKRRICEINQTAADVCVSTCMACVKRLNLEAEGSPQVVHLLELVFNYKIDHVQLQQRLEEMWQGERGHRNLNLLNGVGSEMEDAIAERTENV